MLQGDIYYVEFDKGIGHEYIGKRPSLVIQSDENLGKTDVVTVIAMTSNVENCYFNDVLLVRNETNRLNSDSVVKMNHIYSIDRSRFINKIDAVDKEILTKIKNALKKHCSL